MPRVDTHPPGSFAWIELATTDQAQAKQFYSSLFGWSHTDSPMGPGEVYTLFQIGDRNTAGAFQIKPEEAAIPPHWHIYVGVESADAAAARARELGGNVIEGPFDVSTYGRMAVMADPTGAVFSVWQPQMHPGIGVSGEPGTLCWADLSTPDPARATEFYSGLFGWNISPGQNDASGYLHIQNGTDFIGGIPPVAHRDPNAPPHWLIYFLVGDVDASAQKAASGGAHLIMSPSTIENVGRMCIIQDPQGAVFALFKESAKT
jgi:predicted enzyme related to lactoylglutathione lyase